MAISLNSPVTGAAVTGLTSPTYTILPDSAVDFNSKQWYVSALGGTQTGVTVHTSTAPFTFAAWKPKVLKQLRWVAGQLGLIDNVPMNTYGFTIRKGLIPATGQPAKVGVIRFLADIPAGSETNDAANLAALFSFAFGAAHQQASGMVDTVKTNAM
jgi:hypothetical protein